MTNNVAARRTLEKQTCMRYNVRDPQKAKQRRRCGYKYLRLRSKERRAA